MTSLFTPMVDVLEECRGKKYFLDQFEIQNTDHIAMFRNPGLLPGKYMRLNRIGSELFGPVMTDTPFERRTNIDFVLKAHGNVLIAGLGLGMILLPILGKPEVESITVIELEDEIIQLVAPQLHAYLQKRNQKLFDVACADIFEWMPERGKLYDTIYFDIWPYITADNYPEMKKLHRRFSRRLNRDNPKAFMDSWMRDECRRLYKQDQ